MDQRSFEDIDDLVSSPVEFHVIARPNFLIDNVRQFLGNENTFWNHDPEASHPELLVEVAGRLCYMSFGNKQRRRDNKSYIGHLISEGHESVLEHATWSLLITGVSRAFTHQLVRHRIGFSYSQLSQQYHDESDARFVIPEEIRAAPEALKTWAESMRNARKAYRDLLSQLIPEQKIGEREGNRALRSAARSALPNCTETKIVVTANARSLRHFLSVRGAIVGDLEMRQVSVKLLETLKSEAPSLFSDFFTEKFSDGFLIVKKAPPAV